MPDLPDLPDLPNVGINTGDIGVGAQIGNISLTVGNIDVSLGSVLITNITLGNVLVLVNIGTEDAVRGWFVGLGLGLIVLWTQLGNLTQIAQEVNQ